MKFLSRLFKVTLNQKLKKSSENDKVKLNGLHRDHSPALLISYSASKQVNNRIKNAIK